MKTHTRFNTHHLLGCLHRRLASGSRGAAITLMAVLWLLGSVSVAGAAVGFTSGTSLNQARNNHTTTLLPDGKLLVVGGSVGGFANGISSAEIYDPATGKWTSTGSLNTARRNHTATLLANGKVLVAGGESVPLTSISSAEIYNPATGNWTAVGNLISARAYHTATLLADGKVLVAAGGSGGGNGTYTVVVELFDPATSSWTATGSLAFGRGSATATLLPNGKVLLAGGWTIWSLSGRLSLRSCERNVDGHRQHDQPSHAPFRHTAAEWQGDGHRWL